MPSRVWNHSPRCKWGAESRGGGGGHWQCERDVSVYFRRCLSRLYVRLHTCGNLVKETNISSGEIDLGEYFYNQMHYFYWLSAQQPSQLLASNSNASSALPALPPPSCVPQQGSLGSWRDRMVMYVYDPCAHFAHLCDLVKGEANFLPLIFRLFLQTNLTAFVLSKHPSHPGRPSFLGYCNPRAASWVEPQPRPLGTQRPTGARRRGALSWFCQWLTCHVAQRMPLESTVYFPVRQNGDGAIFPV